MLFGLILFWVQRYKIFFIYKVEKMKKNSVNKQNHYIYDTKADI